MADSSSCKTYLESGLASSFSDFDGLTRDFNENLLFDEDSADVILVVQKEKLPAHRAILAARSQVFRAMFFGGMREAADKEVDVSTFAPSTMRSFLRFLYLARLDTVQLEEMVPLMACADHYGVTSLRDAVRNSLIEGMSPEMACTVLALGRTYQQHLLVDGYLAFIQRHAQQVVHTEAFLQIDSSMLERILEADETRIEEINLFEALVRWYKSPGSEQDRRQDPNLATRLFGCIRYGQMTGEQLVTQVRPHTGDVVPQELYVKALEEVAAPAVHENLDDRSRQPSRRRLAPVGPIVVSDRDALRVQGTTVRKTGVLGWNCTAVFDSPTGRMRFTVNRLCDEQNGIGLALFDPEHKNLLKRDKDMTAKFPNPNQWGADCVVGIYGTGCFFGIMTEYIMRWRQGAVVEVTVRSQAPPQDTTERQAGEAWWKVEFTSDGTHGERMKASGSLCIPTSLRLAVALYSPEDSVTVDSVW